MSPFRIPLYAGALSIGVLCGAYGKSVTETIAYTLLWSLMVSWAEAREHRRD